jgi:serine/threonine protein kinase
MTAPRYPLDASGLRYEFSNEGSCAFAAMELLEGETLRDRLRRGPLSPREATAFARAIADALAAADQRGIVHRDLKLENIFLTADGQLKVTDSGIAHVLTEDASGSEAPTRAPASGAILGTAGYMAPQQLRGERIDARTDIFAFGAVSYEMLAGRPPFTGGSAADISATLNADVPAMTSAGTAALELIVRRCLEKLPQERFQSARDLRIALDAIDTVRPAVVAVSDSNAAPARRHLRAAVAFGVILAIAPHALI